MASVQSTRAGAGRPEGSQRADLRTFDVFGRTAGMRAQTGAWTDGARRGRVKGRWRTAKVLRALRA